MIVCSSPSRPLDPLTVDRKIFSNMSPSVCYGLVKRWKHCQEMCVSLMFWEGKTKGHGSSGGLTSLSVSSLSNLPVFIQPNNSSSRPKHPISWTLKSSSWPDLLLFRPICTRSVRGSLNPPAIVLPCSFPHNSVWTEHIFPSPVILFPKKDSPRDRNHNYQEGVGVVYVRAQFRLCRFVNGRALTVRENVRGDSASRTGVISSGKAAVRNGGW